MHAVEAKQTDKLNSLFARLDEHFLKKNVERKDLMRQYKDIPLPLSELYKNPDYIKNRHGHDLQIKIDTTTGQISKKKRRTVTLIKDSFGIDEESTF